MDVVPVLCGIGRELIWKGSLPSEVHAADNQIGEGATMRGSGGGGGGGPGLDPSVKTGRGWRGRGESFHFYQAALFHLLTSPLCAVLTPASFRG